MFRISDQISRFKWACQRFYRGYDVRSEWALCETLAEIIVPVLEKELKIEGVSGHPAGLGQDFPHMTGKELDQKWYDIRKTILDGMKMTLEEDIEHVDFLEHLEQEQEAANLLGKYFFCLWM